MNVRFRYLLAQAFYLCKVMAASSWVRTFSFFRGRHVSVGFEIPEQSRSIHIEQAVFDLNNVHLEYPPAKVELVSYQFGDPSSDGTPGIASIVLQNSRGYHSSDHFIAGVTAALHNEPSKERMTITSPAYLIPYMTNHFGHFTGECLGSLIAFSHIIETGPRKLYTIVPESLIGTLKQRAKWDHIVLLSANTADRHDIVFSDAKILPRLSPWQNLSIAQQAYEELPKLPTEIPSKVFLTGERESRISNIVELTAYLSSRGFFILNPSKHPFEETLAILRNCEFLLTENGSITHNILISRRKPYTVLTSESGLRLNPSEFVGGGIFNAFHSFHARYIICPPASSKWTHHAYSTQLFVEIDKLDMTLIDRSASDVQT